jgi:5-methylcytosine-specific restriction endonuclease McrA
MARKWLTIELVPKTSWCKNLRNELTQEDWDVLRKEAYRRAGYECEICGGRGEKWPVECHERWEYDDAANVQSLSGLVALCPKCHRVKHIGRVERMEGMDGYSERLDDLRC